MPDSELLAEQMGTRKSDGTTVYEQTSITVDEDRLDDIFAQEVFTPTFDDDDLVSTTDDLEIILGVSVADRTDTRDDQDESNEDDSNNDNIDTEEEVEASSVAEVGTETETETDTETETSHPDELESTAESDIGDDTGSKLDTEIESNESLPDGTTQPSSETKTEVPTDQEYSARQRLHSYLSDSASGSGFDTETEENVPQHYSSDKQSNTVQDDTDGDKNGTKADDSEAGSWLDQLREYLR